MKESRRLFERFDLSPTAGRVFEALLEGGASTADRLSSRAGTYKANTYQALDRLAEAGLVSSVIEGKKRMFRPTNPCKLKGLLEERKRQDSEKWDRLESDLQRALPDLLIQFTSKKSQDVFEVYKGRAGFCAMMREILEEKPAAWKGFGNLQVQAHFPTDFPKWFRHVKIRLFSLHNSQTIERTKEAEKWTKVHVRWLPEELHMPIVWVVFGENLLILIYEPEIIALRIKSVPIVNTFSNQFEYWWKQKGVKLYAKRR